LPGRGLRDRVRELDAAQLLVGRHPRRDELAQLLDVELRVVGRGDERLRHLAGLLVRAGDDRRVRHRRVLEDHGLELGGGDLEALVLDELLEAVDEVEPRVLVGVADVAGAQPPVVVERASRRLVVAEVPAHHLRAADPHLAVLARPELGAVEEVHDLALSARYRRADRAGPVLLALHRHRVRDRAGLGQAVALDDLAAEPRAARVRELGAERSGARVDSPQARQVAIADRGRLREREDDRRDEVRLGHLVALHQLEEPVEVEARHRHDDRPGPQRLVHDHRHAVDVEERQDAR
jgi:hypothetical protein